MSGKRYPEEFKTEAVSDQWCACRTRHKEKGSIKTAVIPVNFLADIFWCDPVLLNVFDLQGNSQQTCWCAAAQR